MPPDPGIARLTLIRTQKDYLRTEIHQIYSIFKFARWAYNDQQVYREYESFSRPIMGKIIDYLVGIQANPNIVTNVETLAGQVRKEFEKQLVSEPYYDNPYYY